MADPALKHPEETLRGLEVMNIPVKVLQEALMDCHLGRAACTDLHAPGYGGLRAHHELVHGLRLRLVPLGWKLSNEDGLTTIVSPDGSFRVAVSSADANTGRAASPRTRNPKGSATAKAVELNEQVVLLFPEFPLTQKPPRGIKPRGRKTWWLLFHDTGSAIQAELSLPSSIGEDGRPDAWSERLKMADLVIGDADVFDRDADAGAAHYEVDVTPKED